MNPNSAQIATAVIAGLALVGAVVQITSARNANRRTAAFRYFERWSDPESLSYIAKMAEFLTVGTEAEAEAKWREWEAKTLDFEERLATLVFINFWEELAGLYNSRLVDRKVIREYLGGLIINYWELGSWFINRSRAEDSSDLQQWEDMYWSVKRSFARRDRLRWYRRAWLAIRRTRRRRLVATLTKAHAPDTLRLTVVWSAGRGEEIARDVELPRKGQTMENYDGTTAEVLFAQRLTARKVLLKLRARPNDKRRLPGLTP